MLFCENLEDKNVVRNADNGSLACEATKGGNSYWVILLMHSN